MKLFKSLVLSVVVLCSGIATAATETDWLNTTIQTYGVNYKDNAKGQSIAFECFMSSTDVDILLRTDPQGESYSPVDIIIDGISYSGSPQTHPDSSRWDNFYNAIRTGKQMTVIGQDGRVAVFSLKGASKVFGPQTPDVLCNPNRYK